MILKDRLFVFQRLSSYLILPVLKHNGTWWEEKRLEDEGKKAHHPSFAFSIPPSLPCDLATGQAPSESWPQRLELHWCCWLCSLGWALEQHPLRLCREWQYLPCRQEELGTSVQLLKCQIAAISNKMCLIFLTWRLICVTLKATFHVDTFPYMQTFLLLTEQLPCFTVNLVFLDLYLMQGLVLHGFHVFLSFIGKLCLYWWWFCFCLSLCI